VASLDITGARNVTFGRDFFGGGVASLLDSDPTRDVIFVGDLTLTGVTGTVRTARSAETDAIFASNDAFFGVNVLNAFDYSGSRPAAIDVTGAIGAEVDRTPAGGLLPVGDSDTAYTFNSCIIGDAISCGTEVPVTEVPAEYIETEITDVEKIIVVNTLFDLPEIFDVDLQTLADVYVSFGNEWLWASTPAFLVDLEGESE
jgi:hypothetical protein